MSKYNIEDFKKWAECYNKVGSFAEVARQFGVNKSVIRRNLIKRKDQLKVIFTDEIKEKLIANDIKKCATCKINKNISNFDISLSAKDGRKYQCKSCQRKRYNRVENGIKYKIDTVRLWAAEYQKHLSFSKVGIIFDIPKSTIKRLIYKHKDELAIELKYCFLNRLLVNEKYYCIACFEIKNIENFEFRGDSEKYRNICSSCCVSKRKLKRKSNAPIKIKLTNEEIKNNKKEYHKKWMKSDRIKYPDKYRLIGARWRKQNPEKMRAYKRKRRAKRIKIDENYTISDEAITRDIFNNKCFKCNSIEKLAIDHHYPLSKGNKLDVGNAVILCSSCNSTKWAHPPNEFYTKVEFVKVTMLLAQAIIKKEETLNDY